MNAARIRHAILLSLALIALASLAWRMTGHRASAPPVSSSTTNNAGRALQAPAHTSPSNPASLPALAQAIDSESPDRRAWRQEIIDHHQALAIAQEAALSGGPESDEDQDQALAAFADSHREAIDESQAAMQDFLQPAVPPGPLPGADAAQRRFAAVRHAVIEDGLTLEEAEARLDAPPPGPR